MSTPQALEHFRTPATPSQRAALGQTRAMADRADENFHVLSWLLPGRLRSDFANLYAYCRCADDLADETGNPVESLELLRRWRDELHHCFNGRPRLPLFEALRETITTHYLPLAPFEDLISAFEQDQQVTRYQSWDQLLDYCRRSANPVGRLVLMICGYRDEPRLALADRTCTALQLTNFWQDVRRDLQKQNRIYIPRDVASVHGLDLDALEAAIGSGDVGEIDTAYRATLADLSARAQRLYSEGRALLPMLSADVRAPIRLFTLGGEAVLRKIVGGGCATHLHRPRLGRMQKLVLLARGWAAGWSNRD